MFDKSTLRVQLLLLLQVTRGAVNAQRREGAPRSTRAFERIIEIERMGMIEHVSILTNTRKIPLGSVDFSIDRDRRRKK